MNGVHVEEVDRSRYSRSWEATMERRAEAYRLVRRYEDELIACANLCSWALFTILAAALLAYAILGDVAIEDQGAAVVLAPVVAPAMLRLALFVRAVLLVRATYRVVDRAFPLPRYRR